MSTTIEPTDTVTRAVEPAAIAPSRRRLRAGGYVPLAVVALVAVVGPLLVPWDPRRVAGPASLSPRAEYLFGTDSSGLDVFSRVVAATATNLLIAVVVTVAATVIGLVVGLLLGSNEASRGPRGAVGRAGARVIDLVEAVPGIIIGLVAVSFYGPTITTLVVVMSLLLAPIQIRLVRTEVLRTRGDAYIDAARMAGRSERDIMFRHVLPNSSWAALENASVVFAVSIILTAGLGFIGVGLPLPEPEWGSMLSRGVSDALVGRWWSALFPAAALAVTVWAVSLASRTAFGRTRS